ncbi:MAG TPA: sigma-70 family RNA polymerase sigma factor [Steroidobacteraceae bacterium]|nr:sigma-70 family RNA polymerase sigma factor [Steroidobacteraceae bacterium]
MARMDNNENPSSSSGEVTQLLQRWADGDAAVLDALWPLVYDDIRNLARRQLMSERRDHTLPGTALVNEAFLRLAKQRVTHWQNREQFLSLASQIMRRVLVDHARRRKAERRGGAAEKINIDDTLAAVALEDAQASNAFNDDKIDVLAVDSALTALEQLDSTQGRIVELRYFGGLTIEETAAVVCVSPATIKREWALARAWLRRELSGSRFQGNQR